MTSPRMQVAAGVIVTPDRRKVLLARRPSHLAHGGKWEFPGGKLTAGETPVAGLRRELREEIGIHVANPVPMMCIPHEYDTWAVELHVYLVNRWSGSPSGREGQLLRWCRVRDLCRMEFPAANARIVRTLQLPALYLVTPDLDSYGADFYSLLDQLLRSGARLVQFRSYRLPVRDRAGVIREMLRRCHAQGARLVINGSPAEARRTGADGVHLNGSRLAGLSSRPVGVGLLAGASCHEARELRRAETLQLDFVTLGPVRPTGSHPGRPGMGWKRLARLARNTRLPVYALGGVELGDLATARAAGAWGISVIGDVWNRVDPAGHLRAAGEVLVDGLP